MFSLVFCASAPSGLVVFSNTHAPFGHRNMHLIIKWSGRQGRDCLTVILAGVRYFCSGLFPFLSTITAIMVSAEKLAGIFAKPSAVSACVLNVSLYACVNVYTHDGVWAWLLTQRSSDCPFLEEC